MASLKQRYEHAIRAWNWAGIVRDAKANVEDGEGREYLGSYMRLFPSGKYYTAWACSNLTPCKFCKGTGKEERLHLCGVCMGSGKRYVPKHNDGIPSEVRPWHGIMRALVNCDFCNGTGKRAESCRHCNGVGSQEAYRDDIYRECLERIAEEHGGSISEGEGDPCDLFFCINMEDHEETDPMLENRIEAADDGDTD